MNQDDSLAQRFMFDAALRTGSNAERLQRFTAVCLDAFRSLAEASFQAAPKAFDGHIKRVSAMAIDRNPVCRYAEWLSSMQANQEQMQDVLKRSIEILATAQKLTTQLMFEGMDANSSAAFGASNRSVKPIIERRTASVVIQFPDRRRTVADTTAVSDAEVQMSAAILS